MYLPLGGFCASPIAAVESVPKVDPQRAQWCDNRPAETGSPENAGRVELRRLAPDVADVVEKIEVELRRQPKPQLGGAGIERVTERIRPRLVSSSRRIIPERGDRELVVAAELLTILRAAQ